MQLEAYPFPHVITDSLFERGMLRSVLSELEDALEHGQQWWQHFDNDHERKLGGTAAMWGTATSRHYKHLASEDFCAYLAETFGMPTLTMDPIGGGYHAIPPGGHLDVHVDFNRAPDGRYRRLNLMTYLNDDWDDPGGRLELHGDAHSLFVSPDFGRTVIFETSDHSWHGHPVPADRWRYSIACYFFSVEAPAGYTHDHSTVWRNG